MKPKEQRAALLADPKRTKRARLALDVSNKIDEYLLTLNPNLLVEAMLAINTLRKFDENPQIYTPRCIIY